MRLRPHLSRTLRPRAQSRRRPGASPPPGITGTVRVDRRTSALVRRLGPGDVAVIDHIDLDRTSAEALVRCQVAAVVNASESVSGRYPALGAEVIAAAGIPLVDVGPDVPARLSDGDRVRIQGGSVWRGDEQLAEGDLLDEPRVQELTERARSGLSMRLEAFTLDSAEFLRREHATLLDDVGIPALTTTLRDRPVVVVSATHDHRAELRALRPYLRDRRPVLVGVDAGADALLDLGLKPDVVVGDLDRASEAVLSSGAELVAHRSRSGRPPRPERLERLGLEPVGFAVSGTPEDAAVLLADAGGAEVVVLVGSPAGLREFLDRGRSAMASTFLTRLRVGPRLVDARTVARLHGTGIAFWQLLVLLLAGLLAVGVAVSTTPVGERWVDSGADTVSSAWHDATDLVRGLTP
jgi:uncharacterized membrane-anchored protein